MYVSCTPKEIGGAIRQMYSNVHDTVQITELKQKFQQPSKGIDLLQNTRTSCKVYGRRWIIIDAFKCAVVRMLQFLNDSLKTIVSMIF